MYVVAHTACFPQTRKATRSGLRVEEFNMAYEQKLRNIRKDMQAELDDLRSTVEAKVCVCRCVCARVWVCLCVRVCRIYGSCVHEHVLMSVYVYGWMRVHGGCLCASMVMWKCMCAFVCFDFSIASVRPCHFRLDRGVTFSQVPRPTQPPAPPNIHDVEIHMLRMGVPPLLVRSPYVRHMIKTPDAYDSFACLDAHALPSELRAKAKDQVCTHHAHAH